MLKATTQTIGGMTGENCQTRSNDRLAAKSSQLTAEHRGWCGSDKWLLWGCRLAAPAQRANGYNGPDMHFDQLRARLRHGSPSNAVFTRSAPFMASRNGNSRNVISFRKRRRARQRLRGKASVCVLILQLLGTGLAVDAYVKRKEAAQRWLTGPLDHIVDDPSERPPPPARSARWQRNSKCPDSTRRPYADY